MVRVPSAVEAGLGTVAPRPADTPFQRFSIPEGAFGSEAGRLNVATGRQAERAGRDIFRAAADVKSNEDNARVKDAETQLNTFMRSRLFLDDDAYFSQRGLNAMQNYGALEEDLYKQRDAILDQLDNETQKNAFRGRSDTRIGGKLTEAARHRMNETENYELQQFNAKIEDAAEDAALDWTPANVKTNVDRGKAEIAAAADRFGWSAEETQERLETFESKVWSGVIGNMLETEPERARKLYNQPAIQAKIEPDQRAVIEKNLRTQENKRRTFKELDRITDQYPAVADRDKAMTEARKVSDPDVRADLTAELDRYYGRTKQITDEAQRQADQDGWQFVIDKQSFLLMPAAMRNAMSPEAQLSAKEYAAKVANGELIKTDWRTYDTLMTMATDQQDRFLNVDLPNTHRHLLADTELKQLVNLQSAIRDGRLPDPASPAATLTQQMNYAIDQMELTGDNKADERGMFRNAVTREVDREQARLGRDLSYAEQQQIVDTMMLEVQADVPWSYFEDIDGRRFQVDPASLTPQQREVFIVPIDSMSSDYERNIVRNLGAYGVKNPSDRVIERAAGLYALGDQQGLQALIAQEKANAGTAP